MFENFIPKKEDKEAEKAENRQMEFQREQTVVGNETHPQQDLNFNVEQDKRSDLLKWQQDVEKEKERLLYRLRGYKLINNQWVGGQAKPLCNQKFIDDVVEPQLEPFFSKVMPNTNLSEKNILRNLRDTSDEVADNMVDCYDLYGIEFINYDLVLRIIKNVMKISSYRALHGWTKKLDSTMSKRVEAITDNQSQQHQKNRNIGGLFSS